MVNDNEHAGRLSGCNKENQLAISRIKGTGAFKKRLLEMGFIPGIKIHIVKYVPLRDPLEVQIKNCHVSLRVCEAQRLCAVPVNQTIKENEIEGVAK